jgi:hypothetical protein
MRPKELRLGNYILDRGGKVLKIDFMEYLQEGYDCKVGQNIVFAGEEVHPMTEYTDYATPTPITDQWITKLGFESNTFNWKLGDFRMSKNQGRYIIAFRSQILLRDVKHVHQLQNLYFALTGEELTI